MPTDIAYGTLEIIDGQPTLRFERRLRHPIDRVWRLVTDHRELGHWFPQEIRGEFGPGAHLVFVDSSMPDEPFEGDVTDFDPPRLLAYTWGTDALRWELEPEGEGTRLVLLHRLEDGATAARDGAGWHACLDRLEAHADGETPGWSSRERWEEVHPAYVERLG